MFSSDIHGLYHPTSSSNHLEAHRPHLQLNMAALVGCLSGVSESACTRCRCSPSHQTSIKVFFRSPSSSASFLHQVPSSQLKECSPQRW